MPHTEYNDGKGIQFSVSFTPLPPTLKPGTKRRVNGKKKSINAIFYMHEKSNLYDMIRFALQAVDRDEDDDIEFKITRDGKLESTMIAIKYSIPRGAKDISLQSQTGYEELIRQATKKGFNPEVKLFMEELKVSRHKYAFTADHCLIPTATEIRLVQVRMMTRKKKKSRA